MKASKTVITSVSFPSEQTLKKGRRNARLTNRSFSGYLAHLIEKDDIELTTTTPKEAAKV